MKSPNIIYPVNDTTFVHILPDPDDVRNYYIPIEPSFLHSVSMMLPTIETKLIDLIDGLEDDPISDKERAEVLRKMLATVAVIRPKGKDLALMTGSNAAGTQDFKTKITTFLNTDFTAKKKMKDTKKKHQVPLTPDGKVILTDEEYRAIEYLLIRDKIDMGVLKPFLSDSYIEDISCDGVGPIFIEHKIFKGLKSVIEFKVSSELDEFVVKMAERIKRPITYRSPIVDATLLDGSRINIVYGTAISRHGSNFSIRKVNEVPLSILNIVESSGIDYHVCCIHLDLRGIRHVTLRFRGNGEREDHAPQRHYRVHSPGEQDRDHRGYPRTQRAAPELDPRSRPGKGKG